VKKFHFPLDRVLDYRRMQLRLEQAKLEHLIRELADLDRKMAALQSEFEQSQEDLLHSQSSLGLEFGALERFRKASSAQGLSLQKTRQDCLKRNTEQRARITEKEREVRLLEKLREDRLTGWKFARDREIDQQAEESFLARWGK
jgi:multidrug resistance efflux pump